MFQVRVGLTPVCTTVGEADITPDGADGMVDVLWARARDGTSVPTTMKAADTAANWLVFMAGCKGEISSRTFHL